MDYDSAKSRTYGGRDNLHCGRTLRWLSSRGHRSTRGARPLCAIRRHRRGFTHLIVRDKGERCVELTLRQSRGLQGRRDDGAGCDARRRAERRWRNLRNRETCGSKGRRDCGVRIERVTRLPFFLSKGRLGRTEWQFGSCPSWNLNRC